MRTCALLFVMAVLPAAMQGQFRFQDRAGKSLELSEAGRSVFVYNYGTMMKDGAPADRARCCYLHPVYAPNGVILTDDFPQDHFHHRGLSWMWQMVRTGGETYDLWTIRGVLARFEKWIRKDAGTDSATLAVQNGWYVGDRKIVTEQVEMVARPVVKRRQDLEFTIRLQAAAEPVDIAGEQKDRKGYGGINIRFAPRADTAIRTAGEENAADSDLKPQPWAELTGVFEGKKAAARIAIDPANPGYPNGWCLRHYGFLGVDFPGLEPYRLTNDRWLVMKYRVTLIGD